MVKLLSITAVSYFMVIACATIDKSPTIKGKSAILVNGLMSNNAGYLTKPYKADLEALGYKVYSEAWTTKRPIQANVCLCHSFGGNTCLVKYIKCDLLVTFDARSGKPSNNSKYVSPAENHYNYYQSGAFSGHPIKGAMNTNVTDVSHIRLPAAVSVEVMQRVREL